MEDVLEVYARPHNAQYPVVCMDETSKQLIGEVEKPQPAKPGQPKRIEHEYVRNGVAQLFLEVEPLTGRSHVAAGETRTRKDWAHWIEGMLTTRYPDAKRVLLVMDYVPGNIIHLMCPSRLCALRRRTASGARLEPPPKGT